MTVLRIAVACLLTSLSVSAFAMGELALLNARSYQCPPIAGCYQGSALSGIVEVKNLSPHKKVTVNWTDIEGEDGVSDAIFVSPSDDGKELWSFQVSEVAVAYFSVSLSIDGRSWTDDNWGRQYHLEKFMEDAILTSPLVMKSYADKVFFKEGYDAKRGVVTAQILVRDISDEKILAVVYSDDDWKTKNQIPASFAQGFPSGVERWEIEFAVCKGCATEDIQFAIRYEDDSFVAWDNNYGRNYRISKNLGIVR